MMSNTKKVRKRPVGLTVVVTPAAQMGEMLMHRKNPRIPWKIATAAVPTKEECDLVRANRQTTAYFNDGDGEEYAVATVMNKLEGGFYITMRPASSRESDEGPVLEKPIVQPSETWTPRLMAWTAGGYADCIRSVEVDKPEVKPANRPARADFARTPRKKDRRQRPADLSVAAAQKLEHVMRSTHR